MGEQDSATRRAAVAAAVWMFTSSVLIFGPVGLALFLAIAYAMAFSNMALAVVCILLLFSPLMFGAVWVTLLGATLIMERAAARGTLPVEIEPT